MICAASYAVEVRPGRSHDRVEAAGRRGVEDVACALSGLRAVSLVRLHDDDLESREAERLGVNPAEAELQHAAGRGAEQFDDARRGRGGERRR